MYGMETDPTPYYEEVNGKVEAIKSREEAALEARAIRAIAEYRLVSDGIVDYTSLGYGLPGGQIIATKLHEHLIIQAEINEAEGEKYDRG